MRIIGITGPTGSGKTSALQVLERLGARVIDCDALYHELCNHNESMKAELETAFPGTVIRGIPDRKKLGEKVFKNPELLEILNNITHKYVSREVERIISEERLTDRRLLAIDAIALIECGLSAICNPCVAVVARDDVRVRRIMLRDGIPEEYAYLRINAQKSADWYIENCDSTLVNNDSEADFEQLCCNYFQSLL